jgi:hypothetical protein
VSGFSVGDHIILEDTIECVNKLCARANISVGCHLTVECQLDDGTYEVHSNDDVTLTGTFMELMHEISAFTAGYFAAVRDHGLPLPPQEPIPDTERAYTRQWMATRGYAPREE